VTSNSSSSGGSSAIALSSVSGASQLAAAFSFYNNSAYYAFLSNSTKLNNTVSPLITAYKSSSAAIACRPLGTGQYPCLGQTVGGRQVLEGSQCEKGYTGFLCSSCATYVDEIYEKSSGNTCILCEKKEQSVYVFLALLLLLSIVLVCLYFIGEARKPQSVKNKYSIGTKTFLNHLQVLSFMGDLQSSWSDLIRSMFGIANLSNLGFSIGNVGCSIKLTFQEKLILYCMSPFIISLAPMFFYMLQCLACYRKLLADTRRRIRFARNHQNDHALYNLDKGHDLDWIQSRYSLEETELLHLTLTWKEHLRKFKTQINERKNTITPEDAIMLRYKLGKELLKKQFFTDSVVVLMVVTFLLFSTISRQIFYTFSVRVYKPYLPHSSIKDHFFEVMEQEPDIFTDSEHYKETLLYAIVFLVIYCILLPFCLFLLLSRRHKAIFDRPGSTSHRTFNFLTHGYNINFYFWEVVVTVRKIIISAIIVFLNTINLRFQIYCIMLVLGICFYATVSFKPFLTRQAQLMELISLSVLLFTCICGLMMNDVLRVETSTAESTTLTEEDKAKNDAFGIVTLILNLIALLFIIFTVAPEYRVLKRLIALFKKSRVSETAFGFSRRKNIRASGFLSTEMTDVDKNVLNNDDDVAASPVTSSYEVEQRARLRQIQLCEEFDLPQDVANDSFDFLLDDAGSQSFSPSAPLLTPFHVYDLHEK